MPSFDHLKRYDVPKKETASYVFFQISGEPTLHCRPATEANRPYHNAVLKKNAKRVQRFRAGRISPEMLAQNRDEDRDLYARYIIREWDNVVDDDGAAVPCSPAAVVQFLAALPDWLFDELRAWASTPANFVADGDESPEPAEVEEQAGN